MFVRRRNLAQYIFCILIGIWIGKLYYSSAEISTDFEEHMLFVGVFTTPSRFTRRSLIRIGYKRLPHNANFKFVVGKPKFKAEAAMLALEQTMYNDILVLDHDDQDEQDRAGKLKKFMDYTSQTTSEFVLKASDTVWLHLENIHKTVAKLSKNGLLFVPKKSELGINF